MQTINARGFVNAGNTLMMLQSPAHVVRDLPGGFSENTQIQAEDRATCITDLSVIKNDCEGLGLNVTLAKVNRLLEKLMGRTLTFRQMEVEAKDVFERLTDELESRLFLAIDNKHVSYYQDFHAGWETILSQFPSVSYDVEEASKCFALNRFTAAVFHLMRVMEVGLYALGNELIIPKLQENWHNAIEQIESVVRGLPRSTSEEKDALSFYSDAAAQLFNVKEAWRNRTAHIGHIYTEEKAEQVFDSVRGSMQVLSTRLTEKPL